MLSGSSYSIKYIDQRNLKTAGLSFTVLHFKTVWLSSVLDYSDVTLNLCMQHGFLTRYLGQWCCRVRGLAGILLTYNDLVPNFTPLHILLGKNIHLMVACWKSVGNPCDCHVTDGCSYSRTNKRHLWNLLIKNNKSSIIFTFKNIWNNWLWVV